MERIAPCPDVDNGAAYGRRVVLVQLSRLNMSRCVEVYGARDQLMFGSKRDDYTPQTPVTREGFEWAGPIPEPKEPT